MAPVEFTFLCDSFAATWSAHVVKTHGFLVPKIRDVNFCENHVWFQIFVIFIPKIGEVIQFDYI